MQLIRKILLAVAVTAALTTPSTGFMRGGSPPPAPAAAAFTPQWQTLKLGAGGQISGFDLPHADGTWISWNNTYGGNLYKSSGSCTGWGTTLTNPCWQQFFTSNSIPGTTARKLQYALDDFASAGAKAVVACESNTNVLYAVTFKTLWVSIDKGANWVATSQADNQNTNTGPIETGKFLACDPNNPDVFYIGIEGTGLRVTYNGTAGASGGTSTATFSTVTGVGSVGTKANVIAFDPATTTGSCVGSVTVTCSLHFWVGTDGTGIYETSTGGTPAGGTFTLRNTANMPTTYRHMHADKFSQLWVADSTSTLKMYKNGSGWVTRSPGVINTQVELVAVDPTSSTVGANRVVASGFDGSYAYSTDNGVTWQGPSFGMNVSSTAPQPVWMDAANASYYAAGLQSINSVDMMFDLSGNLWAAGGVGTWKILAANVSAANPLWIADTRGIEQLVTIGMVTPPGGYPVANIWDRGFMQSVNPDVYPSAYWPGNVHTNVFGSLPSIQGGWGLDWATSDPTFLTGWVAGQGGGAAPAKSTDGGYSWTLWPNALPGSINIGGTVAASSATNWMWVPGTNLGMQYTTNAGTAWNASTVSGTPNWNSFQGIRHPVAADRLLANTFCAVDASLNVYSSTDGGANLIKRINAGTLDGTANADMIISVPGTSDYFWTAGSVSHTGGPANNHLWKITKTTNQCDTATNVNANLKEVFAIGTGAHKPGASGTYPTLGVYGYLNNVLGFYYNTDGASTTTWTAFDIPASQTPFASNALDGLLQLNGDSDVYGWYSIGYAGSAYNYIQTQDACPWVKFDSGVKPNANFTGTVSLTAGKAGLVPVTSVNFYVDSTLIGTQTTPSGTPPTFTQSWNTTGVSNGAHTLSVEAVGNGCTAGGGGNKQTIPITKS